MIIFHEREYDFLKNLFFAKFDSYKTDKNVKFKKPINKKYEKHSLTTNKYRWEKIARGDKKGNAQALIEKLVDEGALQLVFEQNNSKYYKLDKKKLYELFKDSPFYKNTIRPIIMLNTQNMFELIEN